MGEEANRAKMESGGKVEEDRMVDGGGEVHISGGRSLDRY